MKKVNIEQKNRAASLAEEIKALMPHERLRLAADLLEKRQPRLAVTIAESAINEVSAAILLVDHARTGHSESKVQDD